MMKNHRSKIWIVMVVIIFQLAVSLYSISLKVPSGDYFFSYTLANSPYSYDFIEQMIKEMPNDNGWVDAAVLRQDYMTSSYNRFNFSGVYWHQRIDYHPLLYYSLIHFVCSFFPNTYSGMYGGIVNWLCLLLLDILLVLISRLLWDDEIYAVLPVMGVFLINQCRNWVINNQRPYMLFAALALLYYYIHLKAIKDGWSKKLLGLMILTIFLGTQSHYYFYIIGGLVSLFEAVRLYLKKNIYSLHNYILAGLSGIALSLILFPWMLWATIIRGAPEHDHSRSFTADKVIDYFKFANATYFNDRLYVFALLTIVLAGIFMIMKKKVVAGRESEYDKDFRKWYLGSFLFVGIIYSVLIYYLDGARGTYIAPVYTIFLLLLTDILVRTTRSIVKKDLYTAAIALLICFLAFGTESFRMLPREKKAMEKFKDWVKLADDNSSCDVIFVNQNHDNLFSGNWFSIAAYNDFKVIEYEDYKENGITGEDLKGRSGEGLMVYLPKGETLSDGEKLMTSNGYCCWKY